MNKIMLLFVVIILSGSCKTAPEPSISEEMNYSYLALGDSYTIGEGVEVDERWPVQLVQSLRDRGYKVAPPKIIARTGWTTRDLIRNIESEINVQRDFDLVSILIGVNNQYQGRTTSEYEAELREIFKKAINHSRAGERGVFALSIPDYGVTPFGEKNAEIIAIEIDRFNEIFRRMADEFGVTFFNITPISRQALTELNLIAADSLHPSGEMYKLWVENIVDEVAQKLPE